MITSPLCLEKDFGIITGSLPETLTGLDKITFSKCNLIISVTDSPTLSFHRGITFQWIPINEMSKWNYESFFAFWKIMQYAKENKISPIYVHCSGGINRSRCLVASFLLYNENVDEKDIDKYLGIGVLELYKRNIKNFHIPSNLDKLFKIQKEYPTYSLMGCLQLMGT